MSNGLKLAIGWVLTVFVALAFSWGAIAQVRNRVEQPATVIPTSLLAGASETFEDAADTTTTTLVVNVESGAVFATESVDGATTTTLPAGNDETTSATDGTDQSTTSSAGSAALTSSPTTSTTSAGPASSSGTTSTTSTTSTTNPDSSGATPTTTSTTSSTTSTTTAHTMPSTSSTTSTSMATSTTAAPATQTSSYSLVGGTVSISHSPGVVNLIGASPKNGFATEVKKSGPDEVKVIFESDDHESEFIAKWEGGKLTITKEENAGSDDD